MATAEQDDMDAMGNGQVQFDTFLVVKRLGGIITWKDDDQTNPMFFVGSFPTSKCQTPEEKEILVRVGEERRKRVEDEMKLRLNRALLRLAISKLKPTSDTSVMQRRHSEPVILRFKPL